MLQEDEMHFGVTDMKAAPWKRLSLSKICTQIILKKHKVLQDMRKGNYLVWWKSGRIHELWLGEQVRFPQGKSQRWYLRYGTLSHFSTRMWGAKTGEAQRVWTRSALSYNPVDVENSVKTINRVRVMIESVPGSSAWQFRQGRPKGRETRGREWVF